MQHFKKILVYVDPEADQHPALHRAQQLAEHNDAELNVLTVTEEIPRYARFLMQKLQIDTTLKAIQEEVRNRLEALVEPLKTASLKVNACVATGKPFLEIVRMVLRQRHDLVVKRIEPEGGLTQRFFGTVDMHLLRKCPSALWLINPAEPGCYRRILVAVEPEQDDPAKRELGIRLLQMAASLAQLEGAELLVIHAWEPFAENKFKSRLDTVQFDSYLRSYRQESSTRLQAFLAMAGVDIPAENIHLVKGKAGMIIPRFARQHAVDLLVMGTVGRSGAHGLLIGNTAERVLNQLTCSILTVKPPGFVSPVSAGSV